MILWITLALWGSYIVICPALLIWNAKESEHMDLSQINNKSYFKVCITDSFGIYLQTDKRIKFAQVKKIAKCYLQTNLEAWCTLWIKKGVVYFNCLNI